MITAMGYGNCANIHEYYLRECNGFGKPGVANEGQLIATRKRETLALQQVPHDIVFVPSVAWQCLISKYFYVHASFCMHSMFENLLL